MIRRNINTTIIIIIIIIIVKGSLQNGDTSIIFPAKYNIGVVLQRVMALDYTEYLLVNIVNEICLLVSGSFKVVL